MQHATRMYRGVSRWVGASALLAVSCQAVLGIEDLSVEPPPGGAGSGGGTGVAGSDGSNAGSAGSSGVGGTNGSGGSSGSDGASGSDGSSGSGNAGAPPTSNAGSGPIGGNPDGGTGPAAPDGGPPGEPGSVVSGRVIDFFRRPVPNVPVSIGAQTAVTDVDGAFSITGVTPPYAASLMLNFMRNNAPARYGYVYEGLTRTDPTLQVYAALIERSSSSFAVALSNAEFDDEPNRRVILAFASPDGRFVDEDITSDSVSFVGGVNWSGPTSTSGVAHALRVVGEDSFGGSPPVAYESLQSDALEATDGAIASVSFDMTPNTIATDFIAGAPNGGFTGERSNYVALRFEDGTALPLIDESNPDVEFFYEVPAVEDTSLVVAAVDGIASIPPYSVAWRDGVAANDVAVELLIPNPVTPSTPPGDAIVDAETTFSWSTVGQTAQTFLWHLEAVETFEGMLVITPRSSLTLPVFPDGFTLAAGTPFVWSVETHGDAANVDALTGPNGFLDPFAVGENFPVGPGRGSGQYTESTRNLATMGAN